MTKPVKIQFERDRYLKLHASYNGKEEMIFRVNPRMITAYGEAMPSDNNIRAYIMTTGGETIPVTETIGALDNMLNSSTVVTKRGD